jgi:hypothetical protein
MHRSAVSLERLQAWLEREYHVSDEHLGIIRVLYCAFMLFVLGVPAVTWVADNPQLFFNPPMVSAGNLLSGWPAVGVLWGLSLTLVVLFLLLLFGFFVPTVSALVSLLVIACMNLRFSFGKIDHDVLLALVPLVMAFSGWGNRYSLARAADRPNRSGPCIGILAVIVGFAMFTAGYQKATTGWLDPRAHSSYGYLIGNFYMYSRGALLAAAAVHVQSGALWKGFDYFTVGFELFFLVAVIRRSWFRLWIGLAIIFHVGTLLILNIGFSVNFAAYLVFFEWPLPRLRFQSRTALNLLAGATAIVVLATWWVSLRQTEPLNMRMGPSLAVYAVSRVVGQSRIDDTTFEIVPYVLAVASSIMLLLKRRGQVVAAEANVALPQPSVPPAAGA